MKKYSFVIAILFIGSVPLCGAQDTITVYNASLLPVAISQPIYTKSSHKKLVIPNGDQEEAYKKSLEMYLLAPGGKVEMFRPERKMAGLIDRDIWWSDKLSSLAQALEKGARPGGVQVFNVGGIAQQLLFGIDKSGKLFAAKNRDAFRTKVGSELSAEAAFGAAYKQALASKPSRNDVARTTVSEQAAYEAQYQEWFAEGKKKAKEERTKARAGKRSVTLLEGQLSPEKESVKIGPKQWSKDFIREIEAIIANDIHAVDDEDAYRELVIAVMKKIRKETGMKVTMSADLMTEPPFPLKNWKPAPADETGKKVVADLNKRLEFERNNITIAL